MESIADITRWIRQLNTEVREQSSSVSELAVSLTKDKQQQDRRDQMVNLKLLKSQIIKEVEYIKRMETAAERGYIQGTLIHSAVAFSFSSLFDTIMGLKNPIQLGVRAADGILNKKAPYGKVLIAVGKGGLPKDLKVVSVSRMAREFNISESV